MVALVALLLSIQSSAPASVRIVGPKTLTLTVTELASLPRVTVKTTSHGKEHTYEGVAIRDLLSQAGAPSRESLRGTAVASTVIVTGLDGYRAAFALVEFDPEFTDRVSILADRQDGAALDKDAAPFQLILTGEKRAARWVRQVVSIEIKP
jgi:hypothetical protein